MKRKLKLKSPIKPSEKPLPNPGESTSKRLDKLINEDLLGYYIASVVMALFAVMEWIRHFLEPANLRWVFSALAILVCAYSLYKARAIVDDGRKYKRGIEAEKSVGQSLELLRINGSQVFHDIPGDGFNIDHVVVDKTGIYVIETKSLRKPSKRKSTKGKPAIGPVQLQFDGNVITLNGHALERDPIEQVNACSKTIVELLQTSTGKKFNAKPVVLLPGHFIQSVGKGNRGDTWVLNPKALSKFIENRPSILADHEVHMISMHLAQYIRTVLRLDAA